jgi:hypothetical protein
VAEHVEAVPLGQVVLQLLDLVILELDELRPSPPFEPLLLRTGDGRNLVALLGARYLASVVVTVFVPGVTVT